MIFIGDLYWPWMSLLLFETFLSHIPRKCSVYNRLYVYTWIGKRMWLVISSIFSKTKDFSMSQYLYSAIYNASIVSKRSDMDHTVIPAYTPCLSFLRKRSPDGATPNWGSSLLLTYRPRKDERLSWPEWLTYSGRFTLHKWSPVSYRSIARQEKFASQRPTFYIQSPWPRLLLIRLLIQLILWIVVHHFHSDYPHSFFTPCLKLIYSDLDICHAGSSWHYQGQIQSRRSYVKVEHQIRKMLLKSLVWLWVRAF